MRSGQAITPGSQRRQQAGAGQCAIIARREGAMDDEFLQSWEVLLADAVQYRGLQEVWAIRRHQFTEYFQALVDKLIADPRGTKKPLYGVPQP